MVHKRELTPAYIFFYILFLPDTWQISIGLIAAYFLTPALRPEDMGMLGAVMLFMMITAIGYTVSTAAGRWISRTLKNWILESRRR